MLVPETDRQPPSTDAAACGSSRFATFSECPQCSGEMRPEHAHFRCAACGWRDSCCD